MIELKFSTICLQCPYINVTHDIQILHNDEAPFTATGYISCKQRETCKWYDKKAEIMDPIKKKYMFICLGKIDEEQSIFKDS